MADTPVSPKVKSSATTAAAVTFVMYLLNLIPFVEAMPEVVKGALMVLVTAGLTWVAGYATTDPLRAPG